MKLRPDGSVAVRVLVDCIFKEPDNFTDVDVTVEQLREAPSDVVFSGRVYSPFPCVGHPRLVVSRFGDGFGPGPARVAVGQFGGCELSEDDDGELTIPVCDGVDKGDPIFPPLIRDVVLK